MTSAELSASEENYHENTSSESTTTTTTITTNNHFEQGIVNCVVENGKPMDKNKLQQQQHQHQQQQFLNQQQQQNQNNNINPQQQQQKFYQQQHQSMVPNKNNNGAGVSINDNLNESQQQQQQQHYHYQAQPTQPQQPPFSPYRQHQQQQSFMIQHQWSDNNNGGGGSSVVSPARKLSMTLSPIGGHISKTSTMFNQDSSSNGDNGLLLGSSGGLGSLILNNNNSNSANSGNNSSNSDKSANLDSPLRQQQSPLTHHHHHHMRSSHHQTNNTNSPSSSMSSSVDHSASSSSSSLFASSSVMMMHQQQQQQQQQYRRDVDDDELESLNQSISHVLLNGYGDDEDEDGNHVKSSGSVSGNGGQRENKMLNNGDDTTSDYNNNNNNNNTNGSSPTDDNQQQQHGYGAHMMMMSNNNHSSFHNNNNMVDSTWEEDYLMMTSGMSNNGLTPEDLQEYYMMTGHDLMMSGLMNNNNNNNSAMNMMMMNNSGLPNSSQANSSAAAAAAAAAAVEHPLGEHPSRTLFVRNISSHVEDTELREIFESFGPIRSLYTHCKHRGFVMISYYDIRHAKNAMKHLQHKIFKRRKIDIHYSIPKENPTEKDLNQGTLVVFNLDVGINNEELHQIFGSYGEIKEIRETPNKKHHKFIEFFDVRDADRAMKCLNKTDLRGKKIKIEPSRPGGARRNLMYQWQLENMPPLQGTLSNHSSNETSPDSMLFASSPYGNPIMDDLSSGTGMVGSISRQQIINENMMYNNAAAVSSNTMSQQQQQQQQQLNMSLLSQGNTTINNNVNNGVGAMYGGGATAHSPFALNKSIHSPQVQPFSLPQHHQPSFSPQQQQQQQQQQTSSPSSFTMSPHQAFASPHKSFHQANTWSPASMPSMNTTPLHTPMQPLVFAPDHSSLIHNASSNFRLMSPRIMDNGVESTPQMVLSSTQHMMMDSGSSSSSNNSNIHVHHHHHHDPSMPSQSSANMPASTYPPQSANNNPTGLPPTGANFTIVSGNPYANISNKSRSHSSATTTPGAQNGMHDRMRSRNRAMSAEDRKKFYLDLDKVKYGLDRRTTLMVKNIPNKYTQKMLLQTIDQDFQSKYDFFYLPIDFKNKCNVGYAFINFVDPLSIIPFCHAFHAKKWEKFNSEKVCDITYARIQGKQALVNHFQNSSLMCEDPSCRPVFGPAFFLSE